jgi:hypothetical protein
MRGKPTDCLQKQIKEEQRKDPLIRQIVCYLESKELPGEEKLVKQVMLEAGQMELDDGTWNATGGSSGMIGRWT